MTGRPVRSAITAASASWSVAARLNGLAGSPAATWATVWPCEAMRSTESIPYPAARAAARAAEAKSSPRR